MILILFKHDIIKISFKFHRIVCDSWLCLDFPFGDTGVVILSKATKLRFMWNKLLEERLDNFNSVSHNKKVTTNDLEFKECELWENLANYMNTEVVYAIKKLLSADIKDMYVGFNIPVSINYNPFSENFESKPNTVKGGTYLTENITYGW